jgi:hypothetical protein
MIDELPPRGRWSQPERQRWLDTFAVVLDTFIVSEDYATFGSSFRPSDEVAKPEPIDGDAQGEPIEYEGQFTINRTVFTRPGVVSDTYEECIVIANGIDHANGDDPTCLVEFASGRQGWLSEDQLVLTYPSVHEPAP